MVFNTGAALLDAIVLAVVSKEPEGTYGYKITQEVRQVIELSESTLYQEDCRRMTALQFMIWNVPAGTAVTIKLRKKEWHSLHYMKRNGKNIPPR